MTARPPQNLWDLLKQSDDEPSRPAPARASSAARTPADPLHPRQVDGNSKAATDPTSSPSAQPQPTPERGRSASATPRSQPAITHVAIEASAGSGKTHALATRYTSLLLAGADPATILAATFTRKAAGEILARALRTVVARVRDGAPSDVLRKVACAGEKLAVGTLDSFFARIAGGVALDLRVAPHWEIADEDADAELAQRSAERVVASLDPADALRVVGALCSGRSPASPLHAILRAVAAVECEFDAASVSVGGDSAWILTDLPSLDALPLIDEAARNAWADAIQRVRLPRTKKGLPNKSIENAVRLAAAHVRAGDWPELIDGGVSAKAIQAILDPTIAPTYARTPVPPELIAALRPAIEHARAHALATFRARSEATGRIVTAISRAHQAARLREGLLRFSDVPELLIEREGARGAMEFAIDARLSHLLLDEFQDTSLIQFRLLLPLIEEIVSTADAEHSFFCVGDPKQSLYRWRGAEPELLRAITTRYRQIDNQTLATNWRSSPVVLRAADLALATRAGAQCHAEITQSFGAFAGHTPQRAARPGAAALVEITPHQPPPSPGTKPRRVTAAEYADAIDAYVAQRVAEVRARAPWASIGVLVRRNARVSRVLDALRDVGVAASEEAGSPLGDSPGVAAIASLLHLSAFPSDTASYLHVALSPLASRVGAADPLDARARRRLSRVWRARIARAGLARSVAALARAWMRAIAGAPDAPHQQSRLDAAHALAHIIESSGDCDPGRLARILRTRAVPEGALAPVTVLTIHKAKGLEFDAVFAVELDEQWAKGRSLVVERIDDQGRHNPLAPIRRVFIKPSADIERLAPSLRAACEFQRVRALGEDMCGLYVAMTRAVHLLEMLIKPEDDVGEKTINAARLLRQRLSGQSGPPIDLPAMGPGVASVRALYRDGLHDQDAWAHAAAREREELAKSRAPHQADRPTRDIPLRIAAAAPPPWRRPAASPSSLEGGSRVSLGPIFAPRDDAPRRQGTLFHLWASLVHWLDDGAPTMASLMEAARANGLVTPGDDTHARAEAFLQFLRTPAAAQTLRRSAYARREGTLRVRTEWAYAAMVDDAGSRRLLRGQFDRVVWGADARGKALWAHIIDWKTDAANDDDAIAHRVDYYGPQIRAYRLSASALLGVPTDLVGASLVMVESQRVIGL